MRTREEFAEISKGYQKNQVLIKMCLEVLLDIREALVDLREIIKTN